MGKAARAAAAEREPDGGPHGCALRCFGCRFGAAIPVSTAALALVNQMCSPSARDDPAAMAALQGGRVIMVKGLPGDVSQMRQCSEAGSLTNL